MRLSPLPKLAGGLVLAAATVAIVGSDHHSRQTLAPHELNNSDAPPAIIREPRALPKGSINLDSAEEEHLRVVVLTRGLRQPWSLVFLPDGTLLVTERSGRLRIMRNGSLAGQPVEGVP